MESENWSRADCDLMVAMCQYHAQLLYSRSNTINVGQKDKPLAPLVNGVVPAGTILCDSFACPYELAIGALIACGFAQQNNDSFDCSTLLVSSDRFAIDHPVTSQHLKPSHLGDALSAMFLIYDDFEVLGPPDTLRRIFDLFLATGLTEMRHGYLEWSDKANAVAFPRKLAGMPYPERFSMWNPDLFDWFIDEAADQWKSGPK